MYACSCSTFYSTLRQRVEDYFKTSNIVISSSHSAAHLSHVSPLPPVCRTPRWTTGCSCATSLSSSSASPAGTYWCVSWSNSWHPTSSFATCPQLCFHTSWLLGLLFSLGWGLSSAWMTMTCGHDTRCALHTSHSFEGLSCCPFSPAISPLPTSRGCGHWLAFHPSAWHSQYMSGIPRCLLMSTDLCICPHFRFPSSMLWLTIVTLTLKELIQTLLQLQWWDCVSPCPYLVTCTVCLVFVAGPQED